MHNVNVPKYESVCNRWSYFVRYGFHYENEKIYNIHWQYNNIWKCDNSTNGQKLSGVEGGRGIQGIFVQFSAADQMKWGINCYKK